MLSAPGKGPAGPLPGPTDLEPTRRRGVSNGPTEAVNALIKKVKRIGHGFRNLDSYRLRLLRATGMDWRIVTWHAAPVLPRSEVAPHAWWRRAGKRKSSVRKTEGSKGGLSRDLEIKWHASVP